MGRESRGGSEIKRENIDWEQTVDFGKDAATSAGAERDRNEIKRQENLPRSG